MNILRACISVAGIGWVIGALIVNMPEGHPDLFATVVAVFFTLSLGVNLVLMIQDVQGRKGKDEDEVSPSLPDSASEEARKSF